MTNDQAPMTKIGQSSAFLSCMAVAAACVAGCARHLPPPERAIKTNVVALRKVLGSGAEATSTAAASAPVAEPTGWATIKGSFKLNGTPPQRAPLAVTKDHEVCAPGGKPVLSEDLVVDSSGGIKDVVIYLAGPGKFPVGDPKWEHPDYAKAATASEDYDQKNCVFLTHMFGMRSKQKARILNSDTVGHNTNIQGGGKTAPFNATIPAGASATYDPIGESAEPFGVSCSIHPWMSARMIVRDSPYFAVTKADGTFEIANVPAGVPLEFRVWQEKSKFIQDVTLDGKQEKWKSGRFKVTLTPDKPLTMNVVVDVAAFSK
jgi:hypothetical protein